METSLVRKMLITFDSTTHGVSRQLLSLPVVHFVLTTRHSGLTHLIAPPAGILQPSIRDWILREQ